MEAADLSPLLIDNDKSRLVTDLLQRDEDDSARGQGSSDCMGSACGMQAHV